MKQSTTSSTQHKSKILLTLTVIAITLAVAVLSLITGKYPLKLSLILSGDPIQLKVFTNLRLARTVVGILGGFVLGIAGFTYQTVFRNPLASPDIIGVSSGASAGAAFGILFLSGTVSVPLSAFAGALIAVVAVLGFCMLDRHKRNDTIVLTGIAVHSLMQTVLMALKLTADPEKQLASIEYWIMGSLNGVSLRYVVANIIVALVCVAVLFLLHRQIILLSSDEGEAGMLGVNVAAMRLLILLTATLCVACIISLTGLISFIGLLSPHIARLLTRNNRLHTMWLCGLFGSILLCGADILAKTVASHELPVSIFTSLLGAPFMVYLIFRERRRV